MAGIKDIAKQCNVSIGTVSNILNGKGKASDATRQLVMEAVRELNYKPNYMAKNLKQRQRRTIGVITEDLTVFTSPEIVDGINACCEENQYQIILGNLRLYKKYKMLYDTSEDCLQTVSDEISEMLAKLVDGIIYIGNHERELNCIPKEIPIPFVCAYCFTNNPSMPSVVVNDEKGSYDATLELLKSPGRNLGVIAGAPDSFHMQARLKGYQKALYENNIPFNPDLVYYGDWERQSGYEGARFLLSRGVDTILSMNDMMAGGLYEYADDHGIRIGTDISVIGFDNRDFSVWFRPKLTSMGLPLHQLGYRAAELMITLLRGDKVPEHMNYVECPIILRDSILTAQGANEC
ncbi:LacI family DNA-binding transcriptional regulator [Diplocloster agilis]|uniref:LacI family transcriptional regulator n=2 Tax=Diplocloster agilis TaxID=2850323 RepID=A0A949K2B6_9FIRM|nr:LacI family DNA-binding transcriptional regulator [Diplocloster agilis]MBU9739625.1 LacI family transcriptional regulator [Diplocloster agilis]